MRNTLPTAVSAAMARSSTSKFSMAFQPIIDIERGEAYAYEALLSAAQQWGTPPERTNDHAHVVGILEEYKRRGLVTAIDDFSAGHAGLNLLAEFEPDNLKMDMKLIRGIDQQRPRQVIVRNIRNVADDLGPCHRRGRGDGGGVRHAA